MKRTPAAPVAPVGGELGFTRVSSPHRRRLHPNAGFRWRAHTGDAIQPEDNHMHSLQTVFAATAITVGLAAPAFAQNIAMELTDRQAMMITTSGHVMRMKVGAHGHKWMMQNAKQ